MGKRLRERDGEPVGGGQPPIRWARSIALAIALLAIMASIYATVAVSRRHAVVDFVSFWAAARLALAGHAPVAYDLLAHKSLEETVQNLGRLKLPFGYPPPFLFFILPFGLFTFWVAFGTWVAVTGVIYVVAFRRIAPLPFSLAHPAVLLNAMIGQNGFLTSAIFVMGAARLEPAPFTAGLILGLLVIKPQLALLLPIAVIAGRHWRAIVGASLSAGFLLGAALIAFGTASYAGFLAMAPQLTGYLERGQLPWRELASTFAMFRFLGIPQAPALWLHVLVASAATAATAWAWWRRIEARVPLLAAATLLIPPYLWTYDTLLMVVPIGWLIVRNEHPWLVAVLWLLCLLPISAFFGLYSGPNTVPVAAILATYVMIRESRPADHLALGA